MWKNRESRKERKIRKRNKGEEVRSEVHIEVFKLLINGEPVPATKFVLTEKFIYGAWDSDKVPNMDITVEITLDKDEKEETEEEAQREADKEETMEVAQYKTLTDSKTQVKKYNEYWEKMRPKED